MQSARRLLFLLGVLFCDALVPLPKAKAQCLGVGGLGDPSSGTLGGGGGGDGWSGGFGGIPEVPLETGRTRRTKDCRASSTETSTILAIVAELEAQLDNCESFEQTVCEEGNGKFSVAGETLDVHKRYGRAMTSSGIRYLNCDYLSYQAPPVPSLLDLLGPLPPPILPYPTEEADHGPILPRERTID